MKRCEICGNYESDDQLICSRCESALGFPLSKEEEQEIRSMNDKFGKGLKAKSDPLYVSVSDKIAGVLALLGCAASIVYSIILRNMYELPPYLLLYVLAYGVVAVDAFYPNFFWILEKRTASRILDNAKITNPSAFYITRRRWWLWVGLLIITFMMLFFISFAKAYSYKKPDSTSEYVTQREYEAIFSEVMATWEPDAS